MTSCGSKPLTKEESERLNASALYDPPSVKLIEGRSYQFEQGVLIGRGQNFYSQYVYSRAVATGRASTSQPTK